VEAKKVSRAERAKLQFSKHPGGELIDVKQLFRQCFDASVNKQAAYGVNYLPANFLAIGD
jgi:hypothetical protein